MSQTRAKSVAESSNNMERILEEISGKLSTISSKYDNLTSAFNEMENQTRLYREKVELLLTGRNNDTDINAMEKNFNQSRSNTEMSEFIKELSESNIVKEAFRKRSQMKKIWFRLLNERKQAYWNALKSENLADIYENWLKRDEIIFPRKYRIKAIEGEPSEETKSD